MANVSKKLPLLLLAVLSLLQVDAFVVRPATTSIRSKVDTPALKHGELFQSAVPLEDEAHTNENQDLSSLRGGDATAQSPNRLVQFYRWYNDCLLKKPILTKGITAAFVNLFGDVLAQFLEASVSGIAFIPNLSRLEGFFLCGLFYVGPYVHAWYEVLWKVGSWLEEKYNSPKQVQTLVQLILDQTVGVVLCYSTYFYAFEIIDAFVNHRMPVMSAATAKISENLGSVILTNYYIWPITNWISFNYVPIQLRVLLNNVVGVLWNAFLCTKLAG